MVERTDKLGTLFLEAISQVLHRAADPDQVLSLILDQAVLKTGADRGAFIEVGQSGSFTYRVLHRFSRRHAMGAAGDYSRSLFTHVLETGESMLVPNAMQDARFMHKESIQNLRIVSILCQPQFVAEKICGILYLESNTIGHFNSQHQDLLEDLGRFSGQALTAMRAGRDLLEERDRLKAEEGERRQEVLEQRALLSQEWNFGRFMGRSAAVRRLEKYVSQAAASPYPVLISGETGTGKNLLARIIHHGSPRRDRKFVHLSCPSLEQGMVESALFGHRRGAFTGAAEDRIGKVQAAEKGTLFLDEISTLPAEIQPKLLRLLEEHTYEQVGAHEEQNADVRFIAATNKDLEGQVRAGDFRQDLFQRLNFLAIRVPPLRERREDIPLLLRRFLDTGWSAAGESSRWLEITPEAAALLVEWDYPWPGNVRQVQQLAARLAVDEDTEKICVDTMQRLLAELVSSPEAAGTEQGPVASGESLNGAVAGAEREAVERILREHKGATRTRQAGLLGVSESKFYKLLRRYDLG
jgi:transcriptional regulator with GAF, ATPase, and Fis domain